MVKVKINLIIIAGLAVFCFTFISSCDSSLHALEGTWEFSFSVGSGSHTGSFDLVYLTSQIIDAYNYKSYNGTGSIGTTSYLIDATEIEETGDVSFTIYRATDDYDIDSILCNGSLNDSNDVIGGSVDSNGYYASPGTYYIGTGTFSAVKQ